MNQPGDNPDLRDWLRHGEERFRLLFEDAPVPYHEIDTDGRITRVNRAECLMLGYEAPEMVGRPVWEFVVPEEREQCRQGLALRLSGAGDLYPLQRRFMR